MKMLLKIRNYIIQKPYVIFSLIFIGSVIPMIYLGLYAYPQADDFSFSASTRSVWLTTHSIIEVVKQSVSISLLYWKTWAGTFSSVFFFSLQPDIFCNRGYAIVPFLFITILTTSIWMFANTIFVRVFTLDKNTSRTVTSSIIIYVIWNIPDACQAFYWYNSAAHYILSFSMMLVTASLVIISSHKKNSHFLCVIAVITSIIVGGGNYISALLMAVIYLIFIIFFFYTKQKKMILWIFPITFFYVSFFINIIAPGNAERQSVMEIDPNNPVTSIVNSFGYALHFCFTEWINIFIILILMILIPIIWKGLDNCDFSFKYPALVLLVSFCLISAMFAPAAYAERSVGPGRVQNIIFTFYVICIFVNEVYILGWLKHNHIINNVCVKSSLYYLGCIILFLFLGLVTYRYDNKFCNSLTALSIIKNGQAIEYAGLVNDNMKILSGEESVVTIHRVVDGPVFFYSNDIDDWKSGTKAYYNKELVKYDD